MEGDDVETEMNSMLLCMPDLVQEHIIDYLGPRDLLSLRQVCKTTKDRVETYSSQSSRLKRLEELWKDIQMPIYQENSQGDAPTIKDFLNSNLKNITNFDIRNIDETIYEEPNFAQFIQDFSPQIRKLKVQECFDFASEAEWNFFMSLVNLESFEVEIYRIVVLSGENYPLSRKLLCFQNLQQFQENCIRYPGQVNGVTIQENFHYLDKHWLYNKIQYCPKLKKKSVHEPLRLVPLIEY